MAKKGAKQGGLAFGELPEKIRTKGQDAVELWKRSVDLWKDGEGDMQRQARIVARSDELATESSEAWEEVKELCKKHGLKFSQVEALIKARFEA